MRRFLLLCASLLAGCQPRASSGEAPLPSQTIAVPLPQGGSTPMTITHTISAATRVVGRPADAVWTALPSVYATLGIPIDERDLGTRTLGNAGMKVRRRLADVPLGRYLDCGNTQGGPSADTYEIVLSVETRLQPVGKDSTMVTTVVDGRGRPVAFSGDYVRCGSRGALENRLIEILGVQLHG